MSNSANGAALPGAGGLGSIFDARQQVSEAVSAGLKRRYARERRFRLYGMLATLFAVVVLGILLFTIIRTGLPAFTQTMIKLSVTLYPQEIDPKGDRDPQTLSSADYQRLVRDALDDYFPDVTSRNDRRELFAMISPGATYVIRSMVMADPSLIGGVGQAPAAPASEEAPVEETAETTPDTTPEAEAPADAETPAEAPADAPEAEAPADAQTPAEAPADAAPDAAAAAEEIAEG